MQTCLAKRASYSACCPQHDLCCIALDCTNMCCDNSPWCKLHSKKLKWDWQWLGYPRRTCLMSHCFNETNPRATLCRKCIAIVADFCEKYGQDDYSTVADIWKSSRVMFKQTDLYFEFRIRCQCEEQASHSRRWIYATNNWLLIPNQHECIVKDFFD